MVCGIILAAGRSSRMGRPKALLPSGRSNRSFLTELVLTLENGGVEAIVAVVAAVTEPLEQAASRLAAPPRLIVNPDPSRGQLSSLLAGLDVVDRPGVRAVMATPVDVPLVSPETVRVLIEAWRASGAPIVRPVQGTRHGHPVLFDRSTFHALRHADAAVGARGVVHAYGSAVLDVPVSDEGAFIDIDTPGDYERYIGVQM